MPGICNASIEGVREVGGPSRQYDFFKADDNKVFVLVQEMAATWSFSEDEKPVL